MASLLRNWTQFFEDRVGEFLPGDPGSGVEQFELQSAEEGFGQRVVVAVADRAHGAQQPGLAQPLPEGPVSCVNDLGQFLG